jgi:hypothetical protein
VSEPVRGTSSRTRDADLRLEASNAYHCVLLLFPLVFVLVGLCLGLYAYLSHVEVPERTRHTWIRHLAIHGGDAGQTNGMSRRYDDCRREA